MFLWIAKYDLHNFADNNNIAATCKNLNDTLEKESESAVDWFRNNKMIANPGKFQANYYEKKKGESSNKKIKNI